MSRKAFATEENKAGWRRATHKLGRVLGGRALVHERLLTQLPAPAPAPAPASASSASTEQHVHTADDLTDEIHEMWRSEAAAAALKEARIANEAVAGAAAAGEGMGGPSLAGALVLRGSRCVLVRSLENPPAWRGMKLPALTRLKAAAAEAAIAAVVDSVDEDATPAEAAEAGAAAAAANDDGGDAMESYVAAGVRAFSTLCAVDGPSEMVPLANVPPVMVHGNGRPHGPVLLHLYYAAMPPPPRPLEEADMEDEDDDYDWYTFPRAMAALPDEASRIALQTAALALHAAAAAGKVPAKWRASEGGIFGQEFFAGSSGLLGTAPGGMLYATSPADAGGGAAAASASPPSAPSAALSACSPAEKEQEQQEEQEEEKEGDAGSMADDDMEVDLDKLKVVVYGMDLETLQEYGTDLGIPLTNEQGQKKRLQRLMAEVWDELDKRHAKHRAEQEVWNEMEKGLMGALPARPCSPNTTRAPRRQGSSSRAQPCGMVLLK